MAGSDASSAMEFCIRFFTQLGNLGLRHVVVSPGSRSTPLTLGARAAGLALEIQLDERSGGFHALGIAKALRAPVALVCTSGTAAANYSPAVVEAAHGGVPLLIFTADRPPELRGWGASQTIDQVGLYGSNVRWSFEAPVASEAPFGLAAGLAARAMLEATTDSGGPVHINFPFREPLIDATGVPEIVPSPRPIAAEPAVFSADPSVVAAVVDLVRRFERGVIVAGPADHDPAAVEEIGSLARAAGWPILAEASSQLRTGPHTADGLVVSTADALLRSSVGGDLPTPDVVYSVGAPPTSKAVRTWIEQAQPRHVVVTDAGRGVPDPAYLATVIHPSSGAALAGEVAAAVGDLGPRSGWAADWQKAERAAAIAITDVLQDGTFAEPAAVRAVATAAPREAVIYLSNSMPVRDADAVWPTAAHPRRFLSHRGAAGIDGLTSAASGAAGALEIPVVLITGDLAFLHDVGGLMAAARSKAPLVAVVLDNGGGGIFSMLPVAEAIPPDVFDRLYTTPHGMDLAALVEAVGLTCRKPTSLAQLREAVADACDAMEPSVICVDVAITEGIEQREQLVAAVSQAAAAALAG
jgi:2-succinyl-5-enolpyruvyl-6-hydroxy-3-cyclohexene-1-carboxylate synthase